MERRSALEALSEIKSKTDHDYGQYSGILKVLLCSEGWTALAKQLGTSGQQVVGVGADLSAAFERLNTPSATPKKDISNMIDALKQSLQMCAADVGHARLLTSVTRVLEGRPTAIVRCSVAGDAGQPIRNIDVLRHQRSRSESNRKLVSSPNQLFVSRSLMP